MRTANSPTTPPRQAPCSRSTMQLRTIAKYNVSIFVYSNADTVHSRQCIVYNVPTELRTALSFYGDLSSKHFMYPLKGILKVSTSCTRLHSKTRLAFLSGSKLTKLRSSIYLFSFYSIDLGIICAQQYFHLLLFRDLDIVKNASYIIHTYISAEIYYIKRIENIYVKLCHFFLN